jgi:cytochrome c-type biogenesis protein CcmE
MKFKYMGKLPVSLNGVGIVKEGEVFETEEKVFHPQFVAIDNEEYEKELKKIKKEKKAEKSSKDYQSDPEGVKHE